MKRLIRKSEKINNEWYAYHGTSQSNLDNILKNGLIPGASDPYVFLASDEGLASAYSAKDAIVLKIKLTEKNLSEIRNNNRPYPYDDNFKIEQLKEIINRENLDSNVVFNDADNDFDIMIINIEESYGKELAEKIEDEVFEIYFQSAELMVSKIEPNQIVSVKKY